jgi:hypothetical protein
MGGATGYYAQMNDGVIFQCDCHGEMITLVKEKEDNFIMLSIWALGRYPMSLWQRIRHCIYILKNGRPYGDQILLSKDKAEAMALHLRLLADQIQDTENEQ